VKLSELFTKGAVTARPEETVAAIVKKMREHNIGAVVVVKDQRPVGIITDRDVALALGAQGLVPETQAQKVMTKHVLAIPDDTSVFAATSFMRDRGIRRLPIVDGEDRVVGMVSMDDIVRFLGRELHNLVEGMQREMEVK
jgi:CBS domain-containing protein